MSEGQITKTSEDNKLTAVWENVQVQVSRKKQHVRTANGGRKPAAS